MTAMTHRQYSLTGRTCCICDRPCAILDCQCLENFQHNTSEHGSLMKRLTAAFSMLVSAKDLHSFSLCCSCEHHLVVIEQANRIKECIKQVFLETREHRKFVSSQMLKHGKLPNSAIMRQKRLSSAIDSRSFDDSSPRVKRGRVGNSSSFPLASPTITINDGRSPRVLSARPAAATTVFSFDESHLTAKASKVDMAQSFDSAFLPGAGSSDMAAPPIKKDFGRKGPVDHSDTTNNMEYEEPSSAVDTSK